MDTKRHHGKASQDSRLKRLRDALQELQPSQTSKPPKGSIFLPAFIEKLRGTELKARKNRLLRERSASQKSSHKLLTSSHDTLPLAPFSKDVSATDHRHSVLPVLSLSQIDLSQVAASQHAARDEETRSLSPGPQMIPLLHDLAASLAAGSTTASVPSLRSSRSTLRLSTAGSPRTQATSVSSRSPSVRKVRGSSHLRSDIETFSDSCASPSVGDGASSQSSNTSGTFASIHSIKHFGSFCILDTQVNGCPVSATSEDLRYNLRIGHRFHLNLQSTQSPFIDFVTGTDPSGGELTNLVMFSPMVSATTEKTRFLLASLVNVTDFVKEAACEDDEESRPESSLQEPVENDKSWALRSDDLLQGCLLKEDGEESMLSKPSRGNKRLSEDIWLSLAAEEAEKPPRGGKRQRAGRSRSSTATSTVPSLTSSQTSTTTTSTKMDDILSEFMSSLQKLYSDFFILARTPLDDKYFEIVNVSPALHARKEHIDGHMVHTSPEIMADFSNHLGAGKRFRTIIRWGEKGEKKQCYCVPLYGESSTTWLCMLVGMEMPILW